jgi:hypothetical protein
MTNFNRYVGVAGMSLATLYPGIPSHILETHQSPVVARTAADIFKTCAKEVLPQTSPRPVMHDVAEVSYDTSTSTNKDVLDYALSEHQLRRAVDQDGRRCLGVINDRTILQIEVGSAVVNTIAATDLNIPSTEKQEPEVSVSGHYDYYLACPLAKELGNVGVKLFADNVREYSEPGFKTLFSSANMFTADLECNLNLAPPTAA